MAITVWHVGGEDVRFRIPLLALLREQGFVVGAVGSEPPGPFERAGIPYWRYELRRRPSPLADLASGRRLQALFQHHRPDVVHAFDTKPTYLAPPAARRAGVPGRVCTITGMGYLFSSRAPLALLLRPAYRFLQRRACRDSSVTIFQNENDRDFFLRSGIVEEGRARLVRGSGIDLDDLERRRTVGEPLERLRADLGLKGQRVVIMVSRLVAQKGIREYLSAAARVRALHDDVVFLLVGPATREERGSIPAEEVIRLAGRDVAYLGARDDVPALLSLSDLCVLPSYYREGVPRVLLEAGGLGLPLIAADMPGSRDVVRDGWNGLLVPPRDAASLAGAITRLLESRTLRAEMGERAKRRVQEEFSLKTVAGAYTAIYRSICELQECTTSS